MLKGNLPEIFLDTDVTFDILSKRVPHFQYSVRLFFLNLFEILYDSNKNRSASTTVPNSTTKIARLSKGSHITNPPIVPSTAPRY